MFECVVCVGGLIDQRHHSLLASREKVQFVCEGVGGCRIGEVAGGGDSHGLLANETAILKDGDKVVVEAKLEHSKTGFSRYLDMAGETASGIKVAEIFEAYWKHAGFHVIEYEQAGVKVRRPDYWVARVSLLGITSVSQYEKLSARLARSKIKGVKAEWGMIEDKVRRRMHAKGGGSSEKKYFNILGGQKGDEKRAELITELKTEGYTVTEVPGPLLLSTSMGGKAVGTAMPLAVSTTFTPTKALLEKAFEICNRPDNPDPELDVERGRKPRWTTHSLRRMANTVARATRKDTGTSEAEIDIYFGWHEKILLKEMQVHYEALDIHQRMEKAKVTCKV